MKELSFTLVGLDLLLRMVEAKEVIERKGKRNNEAHLFEQVELSGIYLFVNRLIIDDDSHYDSINLSPSWPATLFVSLFSMKATKKGLFS